MKPNMIWQTTRPAKTRCSSRLHPNNSRDTPVGILRIRHVAASQTHLFAPISLTFCRTADESCDPKADTSGSYRVQDVPPKVVFGVIDDLEFLDRVFLQRQVNSILRIISYPLHRTEECEEKGLAISAGDGLATVPRLLHTCLQVHLQRRAKTWIETNTWDETIDVGSYTVSGTSLLHRASPTTSSSPSGCRRSSSGYTSQCSGRDRSLSFPQTSVGVPCSAIYRSHISTRPRRTLRRSEGAGCVLHLLLRLRAYPPTGTIYTSTTSRNTYRRNSSTTLGGWRYQWNAQQAFAPNRTKDRRCLNSHRKTQ